MPIIQDWRIKTRSHQCQKSGRPFDDGEIIFTALFESPDDDGRFDRRDFCADAWDDARRESPPFSFWRSTYEPPAADPPRPEVVAREGAESLLRRLIDEDQTTTENARYILAVMLERKKLLRETDARETADGGLLRIYEHAKTGEVLIVADPQLHLDEVEQIQHGVLALLRGEPTYAPTQNPPPPQRE